MAKVVKVRAKVANKTRPTYDELRQELRDMERDYDSLLMDYEDLNRDYEKEVNEVAQLQLLIAELKCEVYDLQNELAAAKFSKADTKVVS